MSDQGVKGSRGQGVKTNRDRSSIWRHSTARLLARLAIVPAIVFAFGWLAPLSALAVEPCAFTAQCYSKQACDEVKGDLFVCPKISKQIGGKEVITGCPPNEGYCFPKRTEKIPLSVHIGTTKNVADLGDYIQVVYNFALGIAGAVAALMMMIGGFEYLTAAGDKGRVDAGKEKIKNAVIGLALALGAFTILNTINPDLLSLETPRVPLVKKRIYTKCIEFEGTTKCGDAFGLAQDQSGKFTVLKNPKSGDSVATCIGRNCKLAGKNDSDFRCAEKSAVTEGAPPGFGCVTCTKIDETCSPVGLNDKCCTGFCAGSGADGDCDTGDAGSSCDDDSQCKSGLCQTRLGNSCSTGKIGMPCDDDSECRDGNVCVKSTGLHICLPPKVGGFCDNEGDCPQGSQCLHFPNAENKRCSPVGQTALSRCVAGATCPAGQICVDTVCTDLENGAPCLRTQTKHTCKSSNACVSGPVRLSVAGDAYGICSSGEIGTTCDDDDDCQDKNCVKRGDFSVCLSGKIFSACDTDDDCVYVCEDVDNCPPLRCDPSNSRCIDR